MFVVGGYYTNEEGKIIVMMGEEISSSSLGEAYLEGLMISIQFLIEELNDNCGDTRIISNRRDMVNWVNGCEGTGWDNRFLRSKVWSRRWLFEGIQMAYKQDKEFTGKKEWENLAKANGNRWTQWNGNA
ncbi:hypothetical protein PIB30_012279 [Stylosanthes scabra]|uniref:RNase H type-1 domain-containing protein n=1 Tax=Stylosanthes scabra TaxID=79078 RepID=A0ABU6X3H0_9FABA|nr:hypothetical protein [Stylosanthes scabra]